MWYCIATMTKVQKASEAIIALLHAADRQLGEAKRIASDAKMKLVINDIHESQWYLDEAIAHAEWDARLNVKKSSKKNLTFSADGL